MSITEEVKKATLAYNNGALRVQTLQNELSNKRSKRKVMSLDEYSRWLLKTKEELDQAQYELRELKAAKKAANRVAGGWAPAEEDQPWLSAPDCEGWWWFYGYREEETAKRYEIFFFAFDANDKLVHSTGDDQRDDELNDEEIVGQYKFIPQPEPPR